MAKNESLKKSYKKAVHVQLSFLECIKYNKKSIITLTVYHNSFHKERKKN